MLADRLPTLTTSGRDTDEQNACLLVGMTAEKEGLHWRGVRQSLTVRAELLIQHVQPEGGIFSGGRASNGNR